MQENTTKILNKKYSIIEEGNKLLGHSIRSLLQIGVEEQKKKKKVSTERLPLHSLVVVKQVYLTRNNNFLKRQKKKKKKIQEKNSPNTKRLENKNTKYNSLPESPENEISETA